MQCNAANTESGIEVYEGVLYLGRSTTGATLSSIQLQGKYIQRKKKLYHIFVNLDKAFNIVPWEVIDWA